MAFLRRTSSIYCFCFCLTLPAGCGRPSADAPAPAVADSGPSQQPAPEDQPPQTPHRIAARSLFPAEEVSALRYNFRVGDLPLLKQEKPNSCWATVGAMMSGWKKSKEADTLEYLIALDEPYITIFNKDKGLHLPQTEEFMRRAGLRFQRGQSYLPSAIDDLLHRHGPIWFTIASEKFSQHATVVVGLIGYDDPDRLHVIYVDPADGLEHSATYRQFMKKYEGIVTDAQELIPLDKLEESRGELFQIIHYP